MIKKLALASVMLLSVAQAKDYGTVNGDKITDSDIAMTIGQTGMKYDTLDDETKKRVLDMVVEKKLLSSFAMNSGIDKSDEYKSELEILKKDLALNVWIKKEMKTLEDGISKEKLQAEYKKNEKEYSIPTKLQARHVLVPDEKVAKEIIKAIDEAKDKKAKVIELAKKHEKTTGPSDLGWFELERMVPEFSAAADKLKVGEYSKTPVKTQFGYHVIYLDGRKDASVKPFDVVEKEIRTKMSTKGFADLMKKKVKMLKDSAKIELK